MYCDFSYRCRELIVQSYKNEEFKALYCNNLFGDDLGKVVEDTVKGNQVGSKISVSFHRDKINTAEYRLSMAASLRTTIMEELERRTIF